MTFTSTGELLGGLAFFFFGLHSVREGMQLYAGDRLRNILLRLTDNRVKAFSFGALITMVLQSSSATSALLVGLADGGLLTLNQAFAVILGADVGTTAVVFLLAAHSVHAYALVAITIGFGLHLVASQRSLRYLGQIISGIGLVFYGIAITVHAMEPFREAGWVQELLAALAVNPFWAVVGAALFTALVRSSAATLGIALSLAYSGILTLDGALPFVLGANLGTTITAAMAAVGGNVNARRVAGAHLVSKLIGVVIAFPWMGAAAVGLHVLSGTLRTWQTPFGGGVGLEIALAHLLFNVGVTCVFLPLLPIGVRLICRLIPEGMQPERYGPRYLDERALETPSLALAQAAREVLRIAGLAHEAFHHSIALFERGPEFFSVVERIEAVDDKLDCLDRGVRFFLAKMSQELLTEEQVKAQLGLLDIASSLEEVGDIVSKEMIQLGRKRHDRQRTFSEEGLEELRAYHAKIEDLFTIVIGCLTTHDPVLARDAEGRSRMLISMEEDLRLAHLRRLHDEVKESIETSSIHIDLLSDFKHVAQKLGHVAKISLEPGR